MKKVTLFIALVFAVATVQSCKENNDLEEVAIPEPVKKEKVSAVGNPEDDVMAEEGAFGVAKLPYSYDALEPYIDARTMEVHYSKHYVGYINKFNAAIKDTPMEQQTIEQILKGLDMQNKAVRNNGGGFYNHTLYWEIMGADAGGTPKGALAQAINKNFGSYNAFKEEFSEAAKTQFGSGWAWLVVTPDGSLAVGSTPNQDNPLMPGMDISGTPILGLDVWEHAYYLKYQNKRPDYVEAFYNVINWDAVSKKYQTAITAE